MVYPEEMVPVEFETVECPSGRRAQIPKTTPRFVLWHGELPGDDYGGKTVLHYRDEPVFAELAILRAFERAGWQGVWVDSYRGEYRRRYWGHLGSESLPSSAAGVLERIRAAGDGRAQCWDVVCWNSDNSILFAEAKHQGHDRLRDSQRLWLESALGIGLKPSEFLLVEWHLAESGAAV